MNRDAGVPLAIIGMGCRLPGACSPREFWQLLVEGRSAVRPVPPERLNRERYFSETKGVPGKSYTEVAALIDYPQVDLRQFLRRPSLYLDADKVQLQTCLVAAEACRDAGLDPLDLPYRNTGVYIGHTLAGEAAAELSYGTCLEEAAQYLRQVDGFRQLVGEQSDAVIADVVDRIRRGLCRRNSDGGPATAASVVATLISEALQLDGPSVALDAACSSSLQCLALAGRALQQGHIEMALVGGASYVNSDSLILFSQAHSVSRGQSCPFDEAADGFAAGEGQAVIVVKTLPRAMADGDRIHAVVRGIGVSSDGRGKSLWAPRREGQVQAIRRSYRGGLEIRRLQYVEAHATSTQAGDVTELSALAEILREHLPPGVKIPVGGVKANIGHTLETAGLAGLMKVVLSMQHEVVPRQINIQQLNRRIDWDGSPFFVPLDNTTWAAPADGHPRRAAVNAFGIGGLNVHVVVDQYDDAFFRQGWVSDRPTKKPQRAAADSPQRLSATASAHPHVESAVPAKAAPDDAVAIIGMGCVFPGARTLEAYWDLLRTGRDPKCEVPASRWNAELGWDPHASRPYRSRGKLGGFITDFEFDWKRHKVPPKQIARADPLQFMILDAADAALRQAGYDEKPFDKTRVGSVVGTVFGSDFSSALQLGLRLPDFEQALRTTLVERGISEDQVGAIGAVYRELILAKFPAMLDETGSFTPSTLASRITKSFDLMGGSLALDCGGCSSLGAINVAAEWLLSGECDMLICAAGHRAMGLPVFEHLSMSGRLADEPRSPLDARARGFVPGEGVGAILLKRLADARRDGNDVYGIIRGIGHGFEGRPAGGVHFAMRRGLEAAGIAPGELATVEASFCGVAEPDARELDAICETHGGPERDQPLLLGSTVAQLGLLQGAQGMASLLKLLLAMQHRQIPGIVGFEESSAGLSHAAAWVRAVAEPTEFPVNDPHGRGWAAVSNWDDSGAAYYLVVEKPAAVHSAAADEQRTADRSHAPAQAREAMHSSQPCVVRLAAADLPSLRSALQLELADPGRWFERASTQRFSPADGCRLAVVAGSPDELAGKGRRFLEVRARQDARAVLESNGIFCRELSGQRPRVAFLFAGQGSQYRGMLKSLIDQCPGAAEGRREVDRVLMSLGYPDFADLAWDHWEALGVDVWRTQLAVMAADVIQYRALESHGIQPDMVAGHSYGEFPALFAAGAWDLETLARETQTRCRVIQDFAGAESGLLSVPLDWQDVEQECSQAPEPVYVANINAPGQTVVGGTPSGLDWLAQQLRRRRVGTRKLAVPCAFHTPLMRDVVEPFAAALRDAALVPPSRLFISSVTNEYVRDPAEIRRNLAHQMASQIRYVDLVQRLIDDGVGVLVEVGPGQVLTGLHRKILASAPALQSSVSVVATDQRQAVGLRQLLCVQACLEAAGAGPRDRPVPAAGSVLAAGSAPADLHPQVARPQATAGTSSGEVSAAGLTILRLDRAPRDAGLEIGRTQAEPIRRALRRYADVANLAWDRLPDMAAAVAEAESLFGVDELEELYGIAEGAGVSPPALIAHNLRIYPPFGAGCSHFATTRQANPDHGMLHAANEDVPYKLSLRCDLERSVQVRRAPGRIPYVTIGAAGQVGAGLGVNSAGLAVTSASLQDRRIPVGTTRGKLHSVIVKRVLEQARDIDGAVEIIRQERRAGAWAVCLSHHPSDQLCYVEYDDGEVAVRKTTTGVVGCNHSQLLKPTDRIPRHSLNRMARLQVLLGGETPGVVSLPQAQAALRDCFDVSRGRAPRHATMHTVRRVDNQLSVVMAPREGVIWLTADGDCTRAGDGQKCAEEFIELNVRELLAEEPTSESPPPRGTVSLAASLKPSAPVVESPTSRLCQRYVMRLIETPPIARREARPLAGALILGRNALGTAIAEQLRRAGGRAVVLPTTRDPQAALAALQRAWQQGPLPHLFLATARDPAASTSLEAQAWNDRRDQGVWLPFLVCQKWHELLTAADLVSTASLAAATSLGGDFGFSGPVDSVESGALSGLLKAIRLEAAVNSRGKQSLKTRIVDAPRQTPVEELAAHLVRECQADTDDVEVAYVSDKRYVPRPLSQSAPTDPRDAQSPPQGTWVVTGGARGITALVARELAQRYSLRLHLLGSSPLPHIEDAWRNLSAAQKTELRKQVFAKAVARKEVPIKAWQQVEKSIEMDRNLREFAAAGIAATYHACDVSDRVALAAVLARVRAADGPIQGVLHGAGVESACAFRKKKPEMVGRTIGAKVDGAAALMHLTADDPLQWFVAFGSTSGRFGGVGQTDYALANEMLSKLVDWFRLTRPNCRSLTFHWPAWDEVGMAARPETRNSPVLKDLRYMPPREGVAHLVNELRAGAPERELLVADPGLLRLFRPELDAAVAEIPLPLFSEQEARAASAHANAAVDDGAASGSEQEAGQPERIEADRSANAPVPGASAWPLLDGIQSDSADRLRATVRLDPQGDPFLDQHRLRGRPLLPMVVAAEIFAEAAAQLVGAGNAVVAVRDLEVLESMRFLSDEPDEATVVAERLADGQGIACQLWCGSRNRNGGLLAAERICFTGTAESSSSAVETVSEAMTNRPNAWHDVIYPGKNVPIYHGPVFRVLKLANIGDETAWGRIWAPSSPWPLIGRRVAANEPIVWGAVLDACLYVCGIWLWLRESGAVAIPKRIGRVQWMRAPQPHEDCIVRVKRVAADDGPPEFDFTLFGEDGSVVLRVERYQVVQLGGGIG